VIDTKPTSLAESLNGALHELMDDDESVVIVGQDVGRLGGVFRVTKGLQERFGAGRVRDAILAESSIVGQAIGMSLSGLKPVCEIQFEGFVYPAMNQIITQAAKIRTRWNDDVALNLVIRVPVGGGIRAVEHHSESNEAYFAHTRPSCRLRVLPDRCRCHAEALDVPGFTGDLLRAETPVLEAKAATA
jgi:2-oxoisovalerate dehydrogenase E1 component subunit beta